MGQDHYLPDHTRCWHWAQLPGNHPKLLDTVQSTDTFQAPLIALQTGVQPRDIATATATFGFVRQLATSISVVIGSVVYQNEMNKRSATLIAALGSQAGNQLTGSGAGANVDLIDSLPSGQREIARTAFAQSLHPMWIMYVCIAAVGLIVSFFIKRSQLSRQHEVTKTGLDTQQTSKEARKEEKEAKKSVENRSGSTEHDIEMGPQETKA